MKTLQIPWQPKGPKEIFNIYFLKEGQTIREVQPLYVYDKDTLNDVIDTYLKHGEVKVSHIGFGLEPSEPYIYGGEQVEVVEVYKKYMRARKRDSKIGPNIKELL